MRLLIGLAWFVAFWCLFRSSASERAGRTPESTAEHFKVNLHWPWLLLAAGAKVQMVLSGGIVILPLSAFGVWLLAVVIAHVSGTVFWRKPHWRNVVAILLALVDFGDGVYLLTR